MRIAELQRFSDTNAELVHTYSKALSRAVYAGDISETELLGELAGLPRIRQSRRRTYLCMLALGYGPKEHHEILIKHTVIMRLDQ